MKLSAAPVFALFLLTAAMLPAAVNDDLLAQARLIMNSPDITLSGNYGFPTRPAIFETILRNPLVLLRLWETYPFYPRYKARPIKDSGIHVDDPTGISGDLFLVQESGNRRVYLAFGALNHRLVPAFRGKMAVVLNASTKESPVHARIDIYLRIDNRLLGFLTKPLFPLIRKVVSNRLGYNIADIGTILNDLSLRPQETAARLSEEDGALLLGLLSR